MPHSGALARRYSCLIESCWPVRDCMAGVMGECARGRGRIFDAVDQGMERSCGQLVGQSVGASGSKCVRSWRGRVGDQSWQPRWLVFLRPRVGAIA